MADSHDLLTTADLPRNMQAPDPVLRRAIGREHLAISTDECPHGDPLCPLCVVDAARRLVQLADARA